MKKNIAKKKKGAQVILVYSEKKAKIAPIPPYNLTYLAAVLQKHGYSVEIIDTQLRGIETTDFSNAICCGITALTGPCITYAIETIDWIKKRHPKLPIIWGGIHGSCLPIQTAEHPSIDIVVKGEGEATLLELVQKLEKKESIEKINGIVFKKKGKIIENPDREFINMNQIPFMAVELLELDKYMVKNLEMQTSRGCPYQCTFCHNRGYNKMSYRHHDAKRVVDELEYLVKKTGKTEVSFVDDNFFVLQKRVEEFCKEVITRGIKIKWRASCRVDYLDKYSDDFLLLLKQSGCDGFAVGAESGSEDVLRRVKKGATVKQCINALKKCKRLGFKAVISLLIGLPGETNKDVMLTLKLMDEIMTMGGYESFDLFIYRPYGGTPMFEEVVQKYGWKQPKSLKEWGLRSKTVGHGDLDDSTWLTKKERERDKAIYSICKIIFQKHNYSVRSLRGAFNFIAKLFLIIDGKARWKLKLFGFPVEWELFYRFGGPERAKI